MAEETELFRVQPDHPADSHTDIGIHSWPLGSFMPLGFYRPVPIVRFTATTVVQGLVDLLLYALLIDLPGIVTAVACALVALILARRGFVRWLAQASTTWKVATFAALTLNVVLVTLASLSPSDPADGANAVLRDTSQYPLISRHFGG